MRLTQYIPIIVAAATMTACGSNLTCDDPQAYQAARENARVVVPDGLDNLEPGKEVAIPKASPRDPLPPGSPCLDLPPTIQANGSDDDDDQE